MTGQPLPLTVLVTTRNEEANVGRTLASVHGRVAQIFVLDSESTDATVEIASRYADQVVDLAYEHGRIIPWIFQWGLDHLPIEHDWVLILEADQAVTPELHAELTELFRAPEAIAADGFYVRRKQVFRGRFLRWGGYGNKYLLKLFRRSKSQLDPLEQDTRVYVDGPVAKLSAPLEEWNRKEDSILFYLEKHLRYAEAFAQEELERRRHGTPFLAEPRFFGTPDQRVLWLKHAYYRSPLYLRPFVYFVYRYFLRLGILDGKEGFVFHFLQAFWFRLVVDVRLEELLKTEARGESATAEPARSPERTGP
jgi:glycosyltransferase involved in cell wall biosynthesis